MKIFTLNGFRVATDQGEAKVRPSLLNYAMAFDP